MGLALAGGLLAGPLTAPATAATVGCDASCTGDYRLVAGDSILAATFSIDGVLILDWQWDDGSAVVNNFLSVFRDTDSGNLVFSASIGKNPGTLGILSFLNPIEQSRYACQGIAGCTATFGEPGSYRIEALDASVPLPAALPLLLMGLGGLGLLARRRPV